ncbi:KpsF/GutQ family sugar-phosphate isomerase [Neptunomonas phycophila]|uniref:KpsF/GutQ family sugar-phosphate isomerase n=1 Tax=Neptunomonas phycophila TaxID=1572645 RepID=UPI000948A48A|nr:KpsF/GutQ family sugar-phosphate isomerase [Neptunomonas phycophila]MDO6782692.1 KpsF/GutQ family sugar-phosphate isomerase [Neptunomonas phycophila]
MTSVYIQTAKQVFEIEANALNALSERLDSDFDDAVKTILDAKGKVIICGMGKSGIIGKKIAATLASTGTPSFFMHPGEAYHGDLGMVTSDDVFVAISNSGETDEVVKLIPFLKDNNNYLVALTGNAKSTLATAANAHLDVGVAEEACPLQLAPTSSTTATLAMGDALAVTLMKARDFKPENFARFHPGGSLGRRLLSRVEDEMVSTDLPFVSVNSSLLDVIQTMSAGRLGLAIIKDVDGYAMITDGDVRRLIEQYKEAAFSKVASDFMSLNPAQVPLGTRVEDALALVDSRKISSLLVVDKDAIVGVFKK